MQKLLLYKKKRKVFRFSGPKKIISTYVRNFESPLPLVPHRMHLAWPFPSHFLRKHYEDDPIPETRAFSFTNLWLQSSKNENDSNHPESLKSNYIEKKNHNIFWVSWFVRIWKWNVWMLESSRNYIFNKCFTPNFSRSFLIGIHSMAESHCKAWSYKKKK